MKIGEPGAQASLAPSAEEKGRLMPCPLLLRRFAGSSLLLFFPNCGPSTLGCTPSFRVSPVQSALTGKDGDKWAN
jgi:hypothetical protein